MICRHESEYHSESLACGNSGDETGSNNRVTHVVRKNLCTCLIPLVNNKLVIHQKVSCLAPQLTEKLLEDKNVER